MSKTLRSPRRPHPTVCTSHVPLRTLQRWPHLLICLPKTKHDGRLGVHAALAGRAQHLRSEEWEGAADSLGARSTGALQCSHVQGASRGSAHINQRKPPAPGNSLPARVTHAAASCDTLITMPSARQGAHI